MKVIILGSTRDLSISAVIAPNCTGIMVSISPWHCRIGRFLLPLEACRTDRTQTQTMSTVSGLDKV